MLASVIVIKNNARFVLIAVVITGILVLTKLYFASGPKPSPVPKQTIINVFPIGNSNMSGTATLEDIAGSGVILLKFPSLSDDNESIVPAYIHEGTCRKMGKLKYTLAVPDAGESETDLDITVDQLKQLAPLTIDLEKSLKDKTVLACGDITR